MDMRTVTAGSRVVRLIQWAYKADQPVLLIGKHGVGKSTLLDQAARVLQVRCVVRDLSMMEPTDLAGIPSIGDDGRTRYAPPSFLPADGCGLLVFEELNRCPPYMQAPCLQLLTCRFLNDYQLPPGWLPVAAINPDGEDYHVDELDPALLSRFLQVRVVATPAEWSKWAGKHGRVHTKVTSFVEQTPGIFDDPVSNPRAWTYASNLLRVWEANGRDEELLVDGLAGVVGERWARAFLQFYSDKKKPLCAKDIVENYPGRRSTVKQWLAEASLDLVAASIESLKGHLISPGNWEALMQDAQKTENVRRFLSDLPPDLKRQVRSWLQERGYDQLTTARSRRRS